MKTKLTVIYFCDHCNKLYQRKHACIEHEEICSKNPANKRPCFECSNLVKKDVERFFDVQPNYMANVLFCNAKNHCLYPPKAEIKGNWFDDLDYENEPMPKECEKFTSFFELSMFNNKMFKNENK